MAQPARSLPMAWVMRSQVTATRAADESWLNGPHSRATLLVGDVRLLGIQRGGEAEVLREERKGMMGEREIKTRSACGQEGRACVWSMGAAVRDLTAHVRTLNAARLKGGTRMGLPCRCTCISLRHTDRDLGDDPHGHRLVQVVHCLQEHVIRLQVCAWRKQTMTGVSRPEASRHASMSGQTARGSPFKCT